MESFLLVYGFSLTLMMLNSLYGFVSQLYTTELKSSNIKQAVGHGVLCLWSSRLILILNDSSYRVVNVVCVVLSNDSQHLSAFDSSLISYHIEKKNQCTT